MSLSCSNSIDISRSNIIGKCDYKCNYKFKYMNSSCIATNKTDYISLSYDNSTNSSINYNTMNYNVKEIRIYHKSLHSFNGVKSDGEMIIIHNSNTSPKDLLVCLPIRINNTSSSSSNLFKAVIDNMSINAHNEGDSSNIAINYNLSEIIPIKPYFSYTGVEPFYPCNSEVNMIIFVDNLDILDETYDKMCEFIEYNNYKVNKNDDNEIKLFYNEKGPNNLTNNDIYIDCKPIIPDKKIINNENINWDNKYVKLILLSLLVIIILFVLKMILGNFNKINLTK